MIKYTKLEIPTRKSIIYNIYKSLRNIKYLGDIIWFIKDIFHKINNIIIWFPIIWKDYNYDHYFIFNILQFKLIQQRKYLVDNNFTTGTDRINSKITLCLNLLEMMKDGYMNYYDKYVDPIEEKYGRIGFQTIETIEGFYTLKEKFNTALTQEEYKQYKEEVKEAMNKVAKKNEQIRRIFYKTLEKELERWWD